MENTRTRRFKAQAGLILALVALGPAVYAQSGGGATGGRGKSLPPGFGESNPPNSGSGSKGSNPGSGGSNSGGSSNPGGGSSNPNDGGSNPTGPSSSANGGPAATRMNPTGNWMWRLSGPKPGEHWTNLLKLKLEANALTGILSAPGLKGETKDVPIENARLDGNRISFTVVQWLNPPETKAEGGDSMSAGTLPEKMELFTNTYSGTITGSRIVGSMESRRADQQRGSSWVASRVKAGPEVR